MSPRPRTARRQPRAPGPPRRPYPGLFVVLEGIDGAGTTTQAERLCEALRAEDVRATVTREPSDGPIGTLIRQALTGRVSLPNGGGPLNAQTMALLFAADRTDHLEAQVLPWMDRGDVVLCDRYVLSSLAYQGALLPLDWVEGINAFASPPDLTLFLEVPPEVAARRRAGRGGAAELFEEESLQRKIAARYLDALKRRGRKERVVRIDGTLPVGEVTRQALDAIRPLLHG